MARTRIGCYLVSVNDGHLLVARVAPGYPGAGKWTLPGGGIEWGEHPHEALEREVYEESGFELTEYRYVGSDARSFPERDGKPALHWIRLFFAADLDGAPQVTEVDGSVDMATWLPVDRIDTEPTVDLVFEALHQAAKASDGSRRTPV